MPTNKWNRRQNQRRQDVMKVTIEEVNLDAIPFPVAQGRDRGQGWGLFDIDLSHGVGGRFPTPAVGEVWWIKRSIGSRWVLDHRVDIDRIATDTEGGGGGGDPDRSGIPQNVDLSFNVREKKKELEYSAFVTFDAVTTDENGDPQDPEYYVIHWVPCSKAGNIIADERVRQHNWNPNDPEIDDPGDPAAEYYVVLPGNVPRPKVWYYKARVRAVSTGGAKGPWSDWTDPSLPFRDSLPEPPAPQDVDLRFKWKDTNRKPIFSAITRFKDVNYWDIPGFDYEDDISEYQVQLMPLDKANAWITDHDYRKGFVVKDGGLTYVCIKAHTSGGGNQPPDAQFWYVSDTITPGDGNDYVRADPNGDGETWEIRRQKVKDKDAEDTFVSLGVMAENITPTDTVFDVDEATVVGSPVAPFVVESTLGERFLVTSRTFVSGTTWTYEVYRQFNNTGGPSGQAHLTTEALTWLKDPFVYKVDFHNIERPKTVYWRTRVRSKDRFNRLGSWSDWTLPETPWSNIDFEVPPPENLRADIEIRDYKTHPVYKLVARFKDPAPNGWNVPGGDLEDDLHHYLIVAQALLPDVDGYIAGNPAFWASDITYRQGEIVRHEGGRYRSIVGSNTNHEPPNGTWWVATTDQAMFRIPDRRIGVLQNQLDPAELTMTVTLDSDLPPSIMKLLNDADKRNTYMRILTPAAEEPNGVAEVVATTEQTDSTGSDRTYTVERMQKGSENWGHNAGDVVYLLNEHLRRAHVDDKDKDEPGKFNARYTVNLGRITNPKRFYWQVRGRSVDNFGHKSVWTDWTNPLSPMSDPDLIIDAPNYVRLDFDRVHRSRWNRWRAIVEFDEVHYTAPDGDREEDVSRYSIQLATTDGDELDVEVDDIATTIFVKEKRRSPNEVPFVVLLGDELMNVTARTSVTDEVYSYTVERGHKGTVVSPHPNGARVYEYPFFHKTVSAKQDDDKNNWNRVAFPKAQKFRHYKARVRAVDRYNRRSEWTDWTLEGTPADNNPPPRPTDVQIDVDNHKIVATWDYPYDPDDETDPDLSIPSDEAAYFQCQLATQANFAKASILRKDRYVAATRKTFRVKKPRGNIFYFRVRAVDGSGNKSRWAETSAAQNGVPTPGTPTLTFDTIEETKKLRANVLLSVGVTGIDDDVDGYDFQLQPAEFKRSTEHIEAGETSITVNSSAETPSVPFSAYIREEQIVVTDKSNPWIITRGAGGSTDVPHKTKAKIQYFRPPAQADATPKIRRRQTGVEAEEGDPVLAIFGNIQKGLWYRARVRARNTKGLWGTWSDWS